MNRTIFTENQGWSPRLFDPAFREGLAHLVNYHTTYGHLPAHGARCPDGYPVGTWLWGHVDNPHGLTDQQRVFLLSIPGVYLGRRGRAPGLMLRCVEQERIWAKLKRWAAHTPTKPPNVKEARRGH